MSSTPYSSSPVFDETTLPAALRKEHTTKSGVWGVIRVLEGQLKLTYIDPLTEVVLNAGQHAIIQPRQPHFVEPLGTLKMQVDFHNEPPVVD